MATRDDLLSGLNEPQRQAVLHRDGPLLVIAGPGSGKTRVITRRAAMLVHGGASPRSVLAITFTNKAADEMKKRIEALGVARGMWVYTFHALGVRLLREFGPLARVQPGFTIYDDSDQLKVVKEAMAACNIADHLIKPDDARYAISAAKNALLLPAEFRARAEAHTARFVASIYEKYEEMMIARNAVDFDDLLLRVALVLRDHNDVTERLNIRFRYLLIDEYQDTNRAQYEIAHHLSKHHKNICATGDPDQSIYAWRGADIRNILEFERDYPDATIVRLEQNYRSTQRVLRVASELIAHNKRRKAKDLWSELPEGESVGVWQFDTGSRESEKVAETIANLHREGRAWNEFAIFYRVNAISRGLEESLRARGIPYRIARGVEFYNRREIRDVLAYLRVLVNPVDRISLERIINTPPRGIGQTTIDRLGALADEARRPMLDIVRNAAQFPVLKTAVAKLRKFSDLLDQLALLTSGSVADAVNQVLTLTGLEQSLRTEDEIEGEDRLANVQELVSAAARYEAETEEPSLADFLTRVALASDQDAVDPSAGVVMLMTLHAAKGLEFPIVFLVGLEQGMLPHERSIRSGDIEEERRLLFVGITRAMDRLFLTRADERVIRGVPMPRAASQFVHELPEEAIEAERFSERQSWLRDDDGGGDRASESHWDSDEPRPTFGGGNKLGRGIWRGQRSEFADEPVFSINDPAGRGPRFTPPESAFATWKPMMFVQHPSYGIGQIVTIGGPTGQTRATIRFPGHGEKTFVLEMAPMITKLERPGT